MLDLPAPSAGSSCYVPPQPDVRSEYCNLDLSSSWSGFVTQVRNAPFVTGMGFTKEDWKNVKNDLAGEGYNEFNAVSTVLQMITVLQTAISDGQNSRGVNLNSIATQVEQAIKPPPQSEAAGWWLELLANLAAIASYYSFGVDDEVVQKVTGTLSGALFITGQSLYDSEGEQLAEEFKVDADEVAVGLSERYLAAQAGLGKVGEIIVSDAGKLKAADQDKNLGITAVGIEELIGMMNVGGRQWSYEALLPAMYEAVNVQQGESLNNPLPEEANKYECEFYEYDGGAGGYFPFKNAPAAAQLRYGAPEQTLGVLILRGSELPTNGNPEVKLRSPTKALLEPLFKSPSEKGIGLYPAWLFHSAFDYPGDKTRQVRCA